MTPGFHLDPSNRAELRERLVALDVLGGDEPVVEVGRAGEGNMNCVLRVRTPGRSVIVKQSRAWVEKYPQFAAPEDRVLREIEFYRMVAGIPSLAGRMPRLLASDERSRLLVIEDLGSGGDWSVVYGGQRMPPGTLIELGEFLTELHAAFRGWKGEHGMANREMRALNHAHLFEIPLRAANGLDLDAWIDGLEAVAARLRGDREYVPAVEQLGREIYLADGPCLVHGDFFPGSLLRTASGAKVIDPEFGHFGQPEWDWGVFLAHLVLSGQPYGVVEAWVQRSVEQSGLRGAIVGQVAGVEIMRRLMGYARLPLRLDLGRAAGLLELSRRLVCAPGSVRWRVELEEGH